MSSEVNWPKRIFLWIVHSIACGILELLIKTTAATIRRYSFSSGWSGFFLDFLPGVAVLTLLYLGFRFIAKKTVVEPELHDPPSTYKALWADRTAEDEWRCPSCSIINPVSEKRCKSCGWLYFGKVAPSSPPPPPPPEKLMQKPGWECPSCSYRNSSADVRCQNCSNLRSP